MKKHNFFKFFFVCLMFVLLSNFVSAGYVVINTTMASAKDVTSGRSVICSSEYSATYACWRLWDLVTANGVSDWASNTGAPSNASPQYNTIYLNTNKKVTLYQIKYDSESASPSYSYCPKGWILRASADNGSTWVDIDRRQNDLSFMNVWVNFTTNATQNYNAYSFSVNQITNSTPLEVSEMFLYETIDTNKAPNFANVTNNGSNAKYGDVVQFNFTVTDDSAISNIIFSTNMSGTWSNYTPFVASGTNYVYQYNITNNRTRGNYICALVYANDSNNVFNNSIGSCFTVQNTLPLLYTYLPLNNTHNIMNLTANFSVTDADSDITSCYLFVNNTINATILSASLGGNLSINATGMSDGSYSWFVGCNDTLAQLQNSSVYNYVVDVTNPIETNVIMPLNSNASRGNTNLTLNITGFDMYLYGYNLSVYYSNNTLFFNETKVNLSVQSYTLNQQINFTTQDNYTVIRCWSDSHTTTDLVSAKSVAYDILNRKINYDFGKTQISITLLNASNILSLKSFNTTKLSDRYSFTYDLSGDKSITEKTYIFRVVSNEKVYLIKNSGYPAHSVIGKFWVDFNILNSKVEVINFGENFYDVKVITKDTKLITNSIGGLNEICFSGTYRYEKYAPFAPIIYAPLNMTYDLSVGIFYSNATSPNNDDMIYYAIDLLNYSGGFISIISANNSLDTSFLLDTINLSEGSYRINVSVFDINGYTNQSVSDVFTIYHNSLHIPPYWYDFVNNGTSTTNISDVVQFNITFEDNLQLKNYTFYINGVENSSGILIGTIQNVSINYTTGNFSAGTNVCGSFIVYDNNSNSNTTTNSCYTIYMPSVFSLDNYGGFMFIAMVILVFGLLFFAEMINSLAMRFIASIALIGFSIMVYAIQHLIGGVLIGIGILLMLRSFLWK